VLVLIHGANGRQPHRPTALPRFSIGLQPRITCMRSTNSAWLHRFAENHRGLLMDGIIRARLWVMRAVGITRAIVAVTRAALCPPRHSRDHPELVSHLIIFDTTRSHRMSHAARAPRSAAGDATSHARADSRGPTLRARFHYNKATSPMPRSSGISHRANCRKRRKRAADSARKRSSGAR